MNVNSLTYYLKVILNKKLINKDLLFSFTEKYKNKIANFAKENNLCCEYIDNATIKDEFVKKYREHFEKKNKFGLLYLKTKENESTYRIAHPNGKNGDNYLSKTRKPYTQYYFYIHDKILGNMSIRSISS